MVGAVLTKSEERAGGYGQGGSGYGYGYGYGAGSRLKKTEILMIPQGEDGRRDDQLADADA